MTQKAKRRRETTYRHRETERKTNKNFLYEVTCYQTIDNNIMDSKIVFIISPKSNYSTTRTLSKVYEKIN